MTEELKLKDVLGAIDLDAKDLWDQLTPEQKKQVNFFLLNRYMSVAKGKREVVEHHVLLTNELYNKNLFLLLNKHPKLLWQLLCSCSHESKSIQWHEYIKLGATKNKKEQFIADQFPTMKDSDIELLAALSTDKELKEYAQDLGWDKKAINGLKF